MSDSVSELHDLIHACLDGQATDAEASQLNARLRTDVTARDLYLQLADTHSCLAIDEQLWINQNHGKAQNVKGETQTRWFGSLLARPIMAAAAGIIVGLFSASMVFAYVTPGVTGVVTLLQDSFESGPGPRVTGVPVAAGVWSGDYTEITEAQQSIKPATGKKMLRFLRADYDGKPKPEGSYIGEVFRLMDLRPYSQDFSDGGAVVQLSAAFNAAAFPQDEKYECALTVCALDTASATNGAMRAENALFQHPLAIASKSRTPLDRDPRTWQKVAGELRLPPDTEFLLVRIVVEYAQKSQRKAIFAGHYIDDVRLSFARRAPLP